MKISKIDSAWITGLGFSLFLSGFFEILRDPLTIVGITFIVRGLLQIIFPRKFVPIVEDRK